jgi:uncharacterized membrane protein
MPTHWGANGEVNGTSSRMWGAFVLPLVMLALALLMKFLPNIDPRRANYPKFAGTFEAIFISILTLLLIMHIALLAAASGYPVRFERWVPVAIGLFVIVLGNLLPRARPNWFIGVRTPWTLSSDRVWEKTHRLAGYVLVTAGIIVTIMGLTDLTVAPFLMGPVIGVAAVSLVVYSYVEWRREPFRDFFPDDIAPQIHRSARRSHRRAACRSSPRVGSGAGPGGYSRAVHGPRIELRDHERKTVAAGDADSSGFHRGKDSGRPHRRRLRSDRQKWKYDRTRLLRPAAAPEHVCAAGVAPRRAGDRVGALRQAKPRRQSVAHRHLKDVNR